MSEPNAYATLDAQGQVPLSQLGHLLAVLAMPVPPANAVRFTDLHKPDGNPGAYQLCSGSQCAGGSDTGYGKLTQSVAAPSLSGSAMLQESCGSGFNTLFYRHLGDAQGRVGQIANMVLDERFMVPADTDFPQALEFDPDLTHGGWTSEASVQFDFADTGKVRLWGSKLGDWQTTEFAAAVVPGVWHRLQLWVTFDQAAHRYSYQTLLLDGLPIFWNLNRAYDALQNGWADQVWIQQQIDARAGAKRTCCYYDAQNLVCW